MKPKSSLLAALLLAIAFVAAGLPGLDRLPPVHEDEPWQAQPGHTFFSTGVFGNDLFAGFALSESRCYTFPPLSPLLVGGTLHVLGPSLPHARLVPLLLVALALVLTERLGTRLLPPGAGLLAAAILALVPLARPSALLVTGIPMADAARIARYDAVVPALGLLALLAALGPRDRSSPGTSWRPAVAGGLAGLATLSHLYGAAWLGAVALAAPRGNRRRFLLLVLGGFLLALAPYILFVLSGWEAFVAQTRNYGDRFRLLSPGFYVANLLAEPRRYSGVAHALLDLRPGAWLVLAALVAGLVLHRRGILPITLALFVPGFALLLEQKNPLYLTTLWPLVALVAAAGIVGLLARLPVAGRVVLLLVLAAAAGDGVRSRIALARETRRTTPYEEVAATLRAAIPQGSRVDGLPQWALGFLGTRTRYRAILVPVYLAHPRFVRNPIPVEEALDRDPPRYVVLDPRLRGFLQSAAGEGVETRAIAKGISRWLRERGARPVLAIDDRTYGRIELLLVPDRSLSRTTAP